MFSPFHALPYIWYLVVPLWPLSLSPPLRTLLQILASCPLSSLARLLLHLVPVLSRHTFTHLTLNFTPSPPLVSILHFHSCYSCSLASITRASLSSSSSFSPYYNFTFSSLLFLLTSLPYPTLPYLPPSSYTLPTTSFTTTTTYQQPLHTNTNTTHIHSHSTPHPHIHLLLYSLRY